MIYPIENLRTYVIVMIRTRRYISNSYVRKQLANISPDRLNAKGDIM